jgi:hypothetical protein
VVLSELDFTDEIKGKSCPYEKYRYKIINESTDKSENGDEPDFMKIPFYTILATVILIFLFGCNNSTKPGQNPDETGQKVVVGYVNADAFYEVSIQKRVDAVLDWLRSDRSIYYEPSPEQLLSLLNVSLEREIRKTGMKQPGMKIDPNDKNKLAGELAKEKIDKIAARLKEGATMDDVAKEFNLSLPKSSQKITKGENPEFDKVIWETSIGGFAGPVETEDREYLFRVDNKGMNPDTTEWADVFTIAVVFPYDAAQTKLEEERAKEWSIRIVNGFFAALNKFYEKDIDGAQEELNNYLSTGAGSKDALAHYLMMKIYTLKSEQDGNTELRQKALDEINKAVRTSSDSKMKPYFFYALGVILQGTGMSEEARNTFRAAFDILHNDKVLAQELMDTFKNIGDTEYEAKAKLKVDMIESLIREEASSKPRKPEVDSVVMTGEGPLTENPRDIYNEGKEESGESGSEKGGTK